MYPSILGRHVSIDWLQPFQACTSRWIDYSTGTPVEMKMSLGSAVTMHDARFYRQLQRTVLTVNWREGTKTTTPFRRKTALLKCSYNCSTAVSLENYWDAIGLRCAYKPRSGRCSVLSQSAQQPFWIVSHPLRVPSTLPWFRPIWFLLLSSYKTEKLNLQEWLAGKGMWMPCWTFLSLWMKCTVRARLF